MVSCGGEGEGENQRGNMVGLKDLLGCVLLSPEVKHTGVCFYEYFLSV